MQTIVDNFKQEIEAFTKKISDFLLYANIESNESFKDTIEKIFVREEHEAYNNAFAALSQPVQTYFQLHFDNSFWGLSMCSKYMSVNSAARTLQSCDDEDVRETTMRSLEQLIMCLVIYGNLDKFPSGMTYFEHTQDRNHIDYYIIESNFAFMRTCLRDEYRREYRHLFSNN